MLEWLCRDIRSRWLTLPMPVELRFSSDAADLDHDLVYHWISELSYWAAGRSREVHDAAVAGSRNYGVYDAASGRQLAFGRVITDCATFAWLCDVFVSPDARGHGVGKALMTGIIADLEPFNLRRIALRTADAHGLYERYGFEVLGEPERWMDRRGVLSA
ncbi:GNAT family N-acetyltransferase [soil metagenome]